MTLTGLPSPLSPPAPSPRSSPPSAGVPIAVAVTVLLTFGSSWVGKQQLDGLLYELDGARLHQAEETLNAVLAEQRARLLASVRILADDTRIRSTAMTTGFDEGTIRDVLDDLKKSSEVNVLAVLDERGKVRVITGAEGLRQLDLSSSPVIRAALEQPATYTWTLPEQVIVIGVAPIRVGPRVSALLLMGITLGRAQLKEIPPSLGIAVAMFSGERTLASTSDDPAMTDIFRSANASGDAEARPVREHPDFLARVTGTSDSATAAKLVWVVQGHDQSARVRLLRTMLWMPILFATLTFAYVVWMVRKRNGGA